MRLDQYLVVEGYFPSREKAKEAILRGKVHVNGKACQKVSFKIIEGREVEVKKAKTEYVSRSGRKLEAAMNYFDLDPSGLVCLDVGSSTGGFTQYLLNNNVKQVFAVDVGTNQMHSSISTDKRVKLFENTDIRKFKLPETVKIGLIVVDVSFISVRNILQALRRLMYNDSLLVLLFKPQFEAGKEKLKKGIYRDVDMKELIKSFEVFACSEAVKLLDIYQVPLKGKNGNQEYFLKLELL